MHPVFRRWSGLFTLQVSNWSQVPSSVKHCVSESGPSTASMTETTWIRSAGRLRL
jgi:hypothetical protein